MKRLREFVINNAPLFIGFLIILFVTYPVLSLHLTVPIDGMFHLARIQSLADAIHHGVFPVKVHPTLLYSYGYGVGFFYPDLFLYFPALLMQFGLSLEHAYLLYMLFAVTGAYLTAVLGVSHLTRDRLSGVIAGIILITTPFYLNEAYNISIGTFTAMGFYSAAICGFMEIMEERKTGIAFLCIGLTGVLQSHAISFFILLITLFLFTLLYVNTIIKHPGRFVYVLVSGFIAALLSANYLLPAFEQVRHLRFRGQTELQTIPIYEKTLSPGQLLDTVGAGSLIIFLICVIIWAFLAGKKEPQGRNSRLIILTLPLSYTVCSSLFWKLVYPVLAFFQYSVRMLNMVTVLGAVLAGITWQSVRKYLSRIPLKNLAVLFVILSVILSFTGSRKASALLISEDVHHLFFSAEAFDEAISSTGREWHPVEMYSVPSESPATSIADDGNGADGIKHDGGISYETWLEMEKSYYYIPYAYYYGYRAFLLNEEGVPEKELPCSKGENGLVKVSLPVGGSGIGHIFVSYQKTKVQHIGYCISLLTLIVCIVATRLKPKWRNRLKRGTMLWTEGHTDE